MHRVDGPGNDSGSFVEKDPQMGIAGTTITADIMNAFQEEIAGVIEGSGASLNKPDNGQLLAAILTLGGAAENAILNGLMEFWQASGVTGNKLIDFNDGAVWIADQWIFDSGGNPGAATITRQELATGTVPPGMEKFGQPRYYARWIQTASAATTPPMLWQAVEGVGTFAGRTVTVSFAARVSSGTLDVTPSLRQSFGTGGSPSSDVTTTAGSPWTVTDTWARFSWTVVLPSISGKTIGTNPDNFVAVQFAMPTGATFTLEVTDLRLDLGSSVLPLWRSSADELARCQRYFEKAGPILSDPLIGGNEASGWFLWDADEDLGHRDHYMAAKIDAGLFHTVSPSTNELDKVFVYGTGAQTGAFTIAGGTEFYGPLMLISGTPSSAMERFGYRWFVWAPPFDATVEGVALFTLL